MMWLRKIENIGQLLWMMRLLMHSCINIIQVIGNGSVFTTHAYDDIVKELQEKFEKPIDKQKVKNHIKTIKYNWSYCYDVFKNGLSGLAWSPITKMWSAKLEVWESLIQVCHLYSKSSYCFLWYILQAATQMRSLVF